VKTIRLQAGTVPLLASLREIVEYQELMWFLVWRDLKVRYKQTILGAAWAILQPLLTMIVFTLFFGRLAKMPSDGVPYPLFAYVALVPWTYFAFALSQAANSLVGSQSLITKVYFPRIMVPASTLMAGLVDLCLALIVLVGMMAYYHVMPSAKVLWLPAFVALAFVTSLGIGLWLSALNVRFRDVRYVVPFLTQFWLLATPVAYPTSLLNPRWRLAYAINPLVAVVEGFRWSILGTTVDVVPMTAVGTAMALLLLFTGMLYFRRMERSFSDIV
jgi:lipopolysaccharide transport system permease protein